MSEDQSSKCSDILDYIQKFAISKRGIGIESQKTMQTS